MQLTKTNPGSDLNDTDHVYNYDIVLFGTGKNGTTTIPLPIHFTDETLGQYSDLPMDLPETLVSLDTSVPRRTLAHTLGLLLRLVCCATVLRSTAYYDKDSTTEQLGIRLMI